MRQGTLVMLDRLSSHIKMMALILGGLAALGFAPLGLWPVTILAVAGLIALILKAQTIKEAAGIGYGFGVGHFIIGLNWIAGAFRYQDTMPVWLGYIAVVSLSLYIAIYPAMAAALAWKGGKQKPLPTIILFAASWTLTEWMRATVFTGFAWNPLSVALVDFATPAIWIGTYGLSALLVLLAGIVLLAVHRKFQAAFWMAMPVAALWGGCHWANMSQSSQGASKSGPLLHIVQPNIGQQDKYDAGYDIINFNKLEELTGKPGQSPRLILWPEAAIPDYLETEEWARMRVAELLGPKDVLMTGGTALMFDNDERIIGARNSIFTLTPDAELKGRYDKAHLVPYGEYLALRWLLEPLGATRLVPGDIDFIPGPGPRNLTVPGFGLVGGQICYEIIFSGKVVDPTRRPAFIFNPSNDAWFGSWGPPQHLAQAQLRALEEGIPIIRSTPTGISAIIDANGRIVKSLPLGQAGFIQAALPPAKTATLFAQFGVILSLGFAGLLALIGIALGRRLG
jgi:apolipoprotein N-acyltransferase